MSGQLASVLVGAAVFVLLLAPPGYWLLRRAGGGPPRALDLGIALGVGWGAMLPLVWLERLLGAPVLVLPAVAAAVVALRREWAGWLRPKPDLAFWLLPVLAAGLVFWVDQGDARWDAAGASFQAGFDITDRAFYALVSQEIVRSPPPSMQNPLFAGAPLAYSFFPGLAGLLLHLYGGQPLLSVSLLLLPVAGFVFLALALDALLREWGHATVVARALTLALCVLGGDLSFAFPSAGVIGGGRSAHFLAFCSFSAESLYYNPWIFGFPLVLVAVTLAGRWLEGRGTGWLWLGAWCLATLWPTKLFAWVPLLIGAGLAALLLRHRRLLILTAASAVLSVPWVALTLLARASGFRPFVLAPFCPVLLALGAHPDWSALADGCASGVWWIRWPAALAGTAVVLVGGLGVRLVGIPVLLRRAREESGLAAWLGLAMLSATVLALTIGGRPTLLDCVQFLILPQLLLWTFAGPRLAGWIAGGGLRRAAGIGLALMACISPWTYILRKTMPERSTSAVDRFRVPLSSEALAAAGWLSRTARDRPHLVVDWRASRADPAARRPVYVAAIADKRLVAHAEDAHVDPTFAAERRRLVAEIYDTADAERALASLDALRVDWVWVDPARPLRWHSPRLELRARFPGVELYELLPRAGPS